jgi:hypothetical protein
MRLLLPALLLSPALAMAGTPPPDARCGDLAYFNNGQYFTNALTGQVVSSCAQPRPLCESDDPPCGPCPPKQWDCAITADMMRFIETPIPENVPVKEQEAE